ncbi:MAG: PAS domain-containing protein, partial [Elusimicrobiales bacterium]
MNPLSTEISAIVFLSGAAASGFTYLFFRRTLSDASKNADRILDALPDMTLLIDRDYNILNANRKALLILGLSRKEALGRKCYSLLHRAKAPPANCPCALSRADGYAYTAELADALPGMPAEASSFPVMDDHGAVTGFIHVIKDLSAQKSMETRLFQSGKMEALGRLAGGLAHEFNNILSVISSAFYMLRGHLDKSEAAAEDGAAIQKAISTASDLTRHLLTLSQRQLMDLKPTDLNNIIGESMQIINKLLGENIKINTEFGNDIPSIMGDPAQLNNLFMGMLIHTEPPKGVKRTISVKTERLTLDDLFTRGAG